MLRSRALPLLLLPAACATPDGDYPSLAIRDAERVTGTFEPAAPYVPPPTPAPVLDRIAQLASEAARAHQAFLAEAPAVRRTVDSAAGSGVGSDAWAEAEVALTGLQVIRSRATGALAELDRLHVDAGAQGGEVGRIAAAVETVAAQVADQNRTVDSLLGRLPR